MHEETPSGPPSPTLPDPTSSQAGKRSRWVWIAAWVASFAVFAAGVGYLVAERHDGDGDARDEALPELAAMPFPAGVTMVSSPNLRVGDQVLVSVEANTANDVESIALYDGARRVLTTHADPGLSTATLRAPVLSVGPHAIYTVVTDGEGRESISAVSHVDVAPAAIPRPLEADDVTKPAGADPAAGAADQPVTVVVDAEPGETPDEAAARLGVEPASVTVDTTDAKPMHAGEPTGPDEEIPEGAKVVVRVPRDHGATKANGPVVTGPLVGDGTLGAGSGLTMTAEAGGDGTCVVELSADGGQGDIAFYGGSGATAGWARAGRSTGDRTAQIRGLTPGAHVFMARDSKGAQSPPVSITAPDTCRDGTGWTGSAAIVNGNLTIPADVAGARTYLYLRVGTRTYRVPQGQDEYFTSSQVTPISTYLPRLEGSSLALEVWTDRGGTQFTARAQGALTVPDGETITSIIGEPTGLRLAGRVKGKIPFNSAIVLGDQDRELDFQWTSASTRVTKVMWQVLLADRPSSDHRLAPGDLIATGTSELTDTTAAGTTGRFTIDTAKIPGRDPKLGGGGETAGSDGFTGTQVIHPPYVPASTATIPEVAYATAPKSVDLTDYEEPVLTLPSYGETVYVRVTALTDEVAATNSSSTVPVTLPTPDGVNGKPVDIVLTDVTYDAGTRANPWLTDCVKLTVPWTARYPESTWVSYGANVPPVESPDFSAAALARANAKPGAPPGGWTVAGAQLSLRYPKSGPICPDRPDPDDECDGFFECLADAVGQLYSIVKSLAGAVVDLYNGAINAVVGAIVKYSGICQIIEQASDSKGAGSVCKVVMTTVVKAGVGLVLAMAGLPVSLPSPDQIEAALQGDLAQVLVSLADQIGLPCSDLKSADPDDVKAIAELAGADGDVAGAAADPCLAIASAAIGALKEQVLDDTSAATAAGKPWPNVVDIPGASLIPHPDGLPSVQNFSVTAKVADANAQIPDVFDCGVRIGVKVPAGGDAEWLTTVLRLHATDPDRRTWTASEASNDYVNRRFSPWMPYLILPEGIVVQRAGGDGAEATISTDVGFVGLPEGGLGFNRCVATPVTRKDVIANP